MLLDSFYKITNIETVASQHYRISVTLVPEHTVYAGHFPGNPIVPGVCSLHMITECAGKALGYPVVMLHVSVVKFLEIVQPSSDKDLEIDLQVSDGMALKATIKSGERTVMSCKLRLEKMTSFLNH